MKEIKSNVTFVYQVLHKQALKKSHDRELEGIASNFLAILGMFSIFMVESSEGNDI